MERWGKFIVLFLLAAGLSLFFQKPPATSNKPAGITKEAASTEQAAVAHVIDGDSVQLSDGQELRYIGIDAPEYGMCFGKEAMEANRQLVAGKNVRLEKDVSQTDKYRRLLRYVYAGDTFVNEYLVRQGYARASAFQPDVKFAEQFRAAETEAWENNRGLWGGC